MKRIPLFDTHARRGRAVDLDQSLAQGVLAVTGLNAVNGALAFA
jgi:hypothetical protein